jgi:hypothetical protein
LPFKIISSKPGKCFGHQFFGVSDAGCVLYAEQDTSLDSDRFFGNLIFIILLHVGWFEMAILASKTILNPYVTRWRVAMTFTFLVTTSRAI